MDPSWVRTSSEVSPPKNPPGGGAARLRRARLRPGGVLRGIHRGGDEKRWGFRGVHSKKMGIHW